MNDDQLTKSTERVLRQAQKVVNEAKQAIARTDLYFKENNLSKEKLDKYIHENLESKSILDIKKIMENMIAEAREESMKNLNSDISKKDSNFKLKKFMNHI